MGLPLFVEPVAVEDLAAAVSLVSIHQSGADREITFGAVRFNADSFNSEVDAYTNRGNARRARIDSVIEKIADEADYAYMSSVIGSSVCDFVRVLRVEVENFETRSIINANAIRTVGDIKEASESPGKAWLQLLALTRLTELNHRLASIIATEAELAVEGSINVKQACEIASVLDQLAEEVLENDGRLSTAADIKFGTSALSKLVMDNREKAVRVIVADDGFKIDVPFGTVGNFDCECEDEVCTCYQKLERVGFVDFMFNTEVNSL